MADEWSMSDEREFIESLLNTRVNFLMVLYGLFLAAATQVSEPLQFQVLLTLGAAMVLCMTLAAHRAQAKLDLILDALKADEDHPLVVIDKRARERLRVPSARRLVGYAVPWLAASTLLLLAALAWSGLLAPIAT